MSTRKDRKFSLRVMFWMTLCTLLACVLGGLILGSLGEGVLTGLFCGAFACGISYSFAKALGFL